MTDELSADRRAEIRLKALEMARAASPTASPGKLIRAAERLEGWLSGKAPEPKAKKARA